MTEKLMTSNELATLFQGKGDRDRTVNRKKFQAGWERIYGNKNENSPGNRRDRSNGGVEGVRRKTGSSDPTPWCTRPQIP